MSLALASPVVAPRWRCSPSPARRHRAMRTAPSSSSVARAATDEETAAASTTAPSLPPSPADVDLAGLKKETRRRVEREVKKVGKATTKLRVARETVDALVANADATEAELESCPDVDAIERELSACKRTLADLNALNDVLETCKSVSSPNFADDAYARAAALGVRDAPPPRPPRPPKKQKKKQENAGPRKPYWTFVSLDGIDIRVGRTSSDNDEVSTSPECRDPRDWWMHAAGCPGSHVVIRHTSEYDALPRETVVDAATLAVANSKSTKTGKAPVSLVRARQVSKPAGAKAGLVRLSGEVRTVVVNLKDEAARLERLAGTKK